jgi:alcohol dehydrogenase
MMLSELFTSSNPVALPGSRVKVLFGPGSLDRLGELCKSMGGKRILLVTDPGIEAAGYPERAIRSIYKSDLLVRLFDEADENPTSETVNKALRAARPFNTDLIVGLGGGSSMDTAKGVNFLLTNGGAMTDYHGTAKATKPMLPMIAVPTTAGTGSEAQSYALISDPQTHIKMACGDPKALPRLAILDPSLTATQPPKIAAATGIDAIAHAVETAGCTKRNDTSRSFSKQAWQLLDSSFQRAMADPKDDEARAKMLLGAHLAGCAIENSMLGAAHATANPLTSEFNITHGLAVGLMLPHVVRFNASNGINPYSDIRADGSALAERIGEFLDIASIPRSLRDHGVSREILPRLAELAAKQWTTQFNPRAVGEGELLAIYESACT